MRTYRDHFILNSYTIKEALDVLNNLDLDNIGFVIDKDEKLIGSLTDGDVRRGLLKGLELTDNVLKFVQASPKTINNSNYSLTDIKYFRDQGYRIIPVLDNDGKIKNIVNFRNLKSYLPIDAVIMAGGRGQRLRPLTDTVPKPMLRVGDKPIIEHNIDLLRKYGIDDIWISVRYLGDQIRKYFDNGVNKSINIGYVEEEKPLGTIGSVSLVEGLTQDTVLIMNSDLLTTIDLEDFYSFYYDNEADMAVACIPYKVSVPYAVMESNDIWLTGFKEKPSYTYYSNAGIYLVRKEVLKYIPNDEQYNATDLMEYLMKSNYKVATYPLISYWLDIGKPEDFQKAQDDIVHLSI